jgi:hypothetical protein
VAVFVTEFEPAPPPAVCSAPIRVAPRDSRAQHPYKYNNGRQRERMAVSSIYGLFAGTHSSGARKMPRGLLPRQPYAAI